MNSRKISSISLLMLGWVALAATGPAPLRASQESPILDGTWRVTSMESEGKAPPEHPPKLLVGHGVMVMDSGARLEATTFILGPGRNIDLTNNRDEHAPGIYELAGDSLKLCFTTDKDAPRPSSFAGGHGAHLLVMTRVPVPAGANATQELRMLQGAWKPVATTKGAANSEEFKELRFVFDNDRLTIHAGGENRSSTVIQDVTSTPHRLVLVENAKLACHGVVYGWENGQLKLASGKRDATPSSFDGADVDECLTLAKAGGAPGAGVQAGVEDPELKLLQGTWNVVQAERPGHSADKGEGEKMKLVIEGSTATLVNGSKKEVGQIRVNSAATPKRLDMTTGGKGEIAPFIYEVHGPRLKLCWRKPGGERPTQFTAQDGAALMVLEKAN